MNRRWSGVLVTTGALAALLAGRAPAVSQGRSDAFQAAALEPQSRHSLAGRKARAHGRVALLVQLDQASTASYQGGVAGLAPTSTRVTGAARLDVRSRPAREYGAFLERRFQDFEERVRRAAPNARVTHRLPHVFGGVSLVVPESEVAAVRELPGVRAVYEDELLSPDTARSPQFIGARALWRELGGRESAGEGVVVGIVDSGVWPELPSFSDPDPSGNPFPPPPASWTGSVCDFSSGAHPGDPASCNNKLIGARRFMATYDAVSGLLPTEFTSTRDDDGHGSHTASTAAGDAHSLATISGAALHQVSGVAPRAHLAIYKVCGNQGCYASDSVAAINQAIADGVDVINFSIGGGESPYADPVSLAFLDAYAAGVFVAASAGNDGPAADTVAHREPWTTTVAASTDDGIFKGTLYLAADGGASLRLRGSSVTGALATPMPVVSALDFGGDALCENPFAAGTFSGRIVICKRGSNDRTEKSQNVAAGGAAGMILSNVNVSDTINQDSHFLPAIQLTSAAGAALDAFLAANTNVTATITQGVLSRVYRFPGGAPSLYPGTAGGGDVIASFSSRGGPGQTLGISKPDVAAPGVQILAGRTPEPAALDSTASGAPGLYMFISGTSMASPHVAGSAALLKALHPDWSPWQIKSALMTTARTQLTREDGETPADAFDYGSGRVDLGQAGHPGLTFRSPAKQDFLDHRADLWSLDYPSLYVPVHPGVTTVRRTLHSELSRSAVWYVEAWASRDVEIRVPRFVYLKAHGDRTIAITVDARHVPIGEVRFARLRFRHDDTRADFPITIARQQPAVSIEKSCEPTEFQLGDATDCTITFSNPSPDPQPVRVTDHLPRELKLFGPVIGAVKVNDRFLRYDGTLAGAAPPGVEIATGVSPAGGYLPLRLFAIPPIDGMGDETIVNFDVPAFVYAGETYTQLGVVSNGYIVVGGGSAADVDSLNQVFPDPARPNNVLAPFWTDLNPAVGGAVRAGSLTDGVNTWLVVDWEGVVNHSDHQPNSFQAWIRIGDTEDISFAYGGLSAGDGGHATVGAENRFGSRGANYYADGTGSLPDAQTQLVVSSTPGGTGETHVIRFTAKGVAAGKWENCAEMTGGFFGTAVSCVDGEVEKLHHHGPRCGWGRKHHHDDGRRDGDDREDERDRDDHHDR